ncbi:hypothetical protein [Novosphingobium sp. FSW06-99]|uniref:hypothetical protein n=1 Tax=Novosphingobium sp. FSW06-99 TaxID=1739113 RepID=UPI0012E3C557|nr:hypothetical protein [Novosphingobium sp. FSW06-99]
MSRFLLLASLALIPNSAFAQEAGNRLYLLCDGGGTANKADGSFAQGWNNHGGTSSALAIGHATVGFEDQLQIWIEGNAGKARMPRSMLPKLHGGEGGWFEISDVVVADREITGTVRVNFANHPKLILDRLAGTITLSGKVGNFNGRCRKFDPATAEKAF